MAVARLPGVPVTYRDGAEGQVGVALGPRRLRQRVVVELHYVCGLHQRVPRRQLNQEAVLQRFRRPLVNQGLRLALRVPADGREKY